MKKKCRIFTLIELLVVIAIIAILASLLLPALRMAKYTAKNIICLSQIKQMHLGLMNYASNNNNFYPGFYREQGIGSNETGRRYATKITDTNTGFSPNPIGIRDLVVDYFGPINDLMRCPLRSTEWDSPTFLDNPANNHKITDFTDTSSWTRKTPYSFYFNSCANAQDKKRDYDKPVLRVGDPIKPHEDNPWKGNEYHYILSDMVVASGGTDLVVAQQPMSGLQLQFGNYWNYGMGWKIINGMFSLANYCRDDGSAKSYTVGYSQLSGLDPDLISLRASTTLSEGYVIPNEE